MGCLILGIIVAVVGVMSLFVGIEEGDTLLTILGVVFTLPTIFVVLVMIFGNNEKAKKDQDDNKKRFEDKIKKKFDEEKVELSQQYRTYNYSVVGLDENNRKVCFLESNSDMNLKDLNYFGAVTDDIQYSARTFHYIDILESEVIIDGETVTKTSRSSQVGGAILGGILAGGVGAIIGGLSGKTSSKEKVKTIQLKVIVNDTKKPLEIITFLNEPTSIDRSNEKFIKANKEVMHWHSLFKVIIDMADKEDKSKNVIQNNTDESNPTFNTADEIRKLHDLFKEGIITQEEFDLQKKKIIS
ncbi:SHOCT domain-containing protein [Metabacillus halosaccharovorans]|uniref:SHOCT domain-containing protein n=1 Tax=Metabacillus halosaccharovorans TaxID=930124 RepID=A0ABT3DNZ9_9BACI|nr:SHOCT domain-containing protein [Metabacillus halosaccharovorans]MCV9888772.1 SHOCT domain-containing protein [Metabacillus halosaccharovorans]